MTKRNVFLDLTSSDQSDLVEDKTNKPKQQQGGHMKALTVKFSQERETKRTVRYAEVADDDSKVIGTLYLSKTVFGDGAAPEKLTVSVKQSS